MLVQEGCRISSAVVKKDRKAYFKMKTKISNWEPGTFFLFIPIQMKHHCIMSVTDLKYFIAS